MMMMMQSTQRKVRIWVFLGNSKRGSGSCDKAEEEIEVGGRMVNKKGLLEKL